MSKGRREDETGEREDDRPAKKKEQKIIYIDDGSTVADMSGTFRGGRKDARPRSTFKEKARTYFSVVKKMILPLLVTLIAFTVVIILFLFAAGKL